MEAFLHKFLYKFQHLKIQLEEIRQGTDNFNDETNSIGVGGFGNVYKGEVSDHSEGRRVVAVKRLDPNRGQGAPEFLKEITMLSDYKHENIISLLGFCCERSEMILVYEHASRGSLDRYLNSPRLTWIQRLNICLDAAKGLHYLHDPRETHRRLIHCDVKSGNILLDDQWNAKVSDLGLSIMGSANEQHSVIVTLAAGTEGYIDPLYWMTHTLTKESDVYSFGVVLLEVLFGSLCFTVDSSGRHLQEILVPKWKEYYEEKTLNDFIFKDPSIQPLEQSALEIFSDIAYRCLKEDREDRPEMDEVVMELESALESQELPESQEFKGEWNKQRFYEDMTKSAQPPLNYNSDDELMNLLFKGVLLRRGKTWFSLNKNGEHYEMISIAECLGPKFKSEHTRYKSRFAKGTYYSTKRLFNTHVKTQFLSPGITYAVNLVFKFCDQNKVRNCRHISLKYKLRGEKESFISYLAYERQDGWWMAELYQFTCDHKNVYLQILFEGFRDYVFIEVEGIEFRPLEKVDCNEDVNQPISNSDSDANWDEKLLPIDFEDIMKRSANSMQWTTKEEAYSTMSKGFLINSDYKDSSIWFYLDKNGKKCYMLSGKLVVHGVSMHPIPEPRFSRFGQAIQCDSRLFDLEYKVESHLVSSQTTYAVYLVYKLSKDQSGFEAPMRVGDVLREESCSYIYLVSPQTPVIKPKADQNTHNPLNKLITKGLPQQRNDGWMEVQVSEFQSTTNYRSLEVMSTGGNHKKFRGLIIEGLEIKPI